MIEFQKEGGDDIFFSIAIPAFKARYLYESILSVLRQTYNRFELIILNDASPDNIDGVVQKFEDDRIVYVQNEENVGAIDVVDNWNKCFRLSKGNYFILMGDDDTLEPNYLEVFLNLILKYPALQVYHCRSTIIDENSKPINLTPINPEYESVFDYILSCLKSYRQQYISDFVYRSSTLKDRGGFYKLPLAWGSDYLTAFIAARGQGIAHTNELVFNYRMNRYSITSVGSILLKREASLSYERWIEDFLQTNPASPLETLLHSLLLTAFAEYRVASKTQALKQILMQKKGLSGVIYAVRNRRRLAMSLSDIFKISVKIVLVYALK